MTREEVEVQFTGLAHDHMMVMNKQQSPAATLMPNTNINNTNQISNSPPQQQNQQNASALSTIAILRRHPMYDSLVLVKKYRACLGGYTLEFPTNNTTTTGTTTTTTTTGNNNSSNKTTGSEQQQPSECCKTKLVSLYLDGDDPIYQCQESKCKNSGLTSDGEIVYVPMNGLLTRLDTYEKHGISVDSRVYAFAMGLKTAEKFLQSSSMKELQETPPL